ncbi:MAG: GNAT family N-acetyltransferase [Bacteroidales bacterium]|nr:GNAT family N-acetyltransferase [Bacteroidales bacterium]
MKFLPITSYDLDEIKHLQPEDWSDIIPDMEFYIRSGFCRTVKACVDNRIAGIGVMIVYDNTAWLAHIIVDASFRNRGIGLGIVSELLQGLRDYPVTTCMLTATELGKPVYVKAGFRTVSEYIFMNREKSGLDYPVAPNIVEYNAQHRAQILQMDRRVSAENRERLLITHLEGSQVYLKNGIVQGYFIPGLKEGPVIAENPEAGMELLKVKFTQAERIVLPSENITGIEFLKQNGYAETPIKGTRMVLGENLTWQPEMIFSRIGGNFG